MRPPATTLATAPLLLARRPTLAQLRPRPARDRLESDRARRRLESLSPPSKHRSTGALRSTPVPRTDRPHRRRQNPTTPVARSSGRQRPQPRTPRRSPRLTPRSRTRPPATHSEILRIPPLRHTPPHQPITRNLRGSRKPPRRTPANPAPTLAPHDGRSRHRNHRPHRITSARANTRLRPLRPPPGNTRQPAAHPHRSPLPLPSRNLAKPRAHPPVAPAGPVIAPAPLRSRISPVSRLSRPVPH